MMGSLLKWAGTLRRRQREGKASMFRLLSCTLSFRGFWFGSHGPFIWFDYSFFSTSENSATDPLLSFPFWRCVLGLAIYGSVFCCRLLGALINLTDLRYGFQGYINGNTVEDISIFWVFFTMQFFLSQSGSHFISHRFQLASIVAIL